MYITYSLIVIDVFLSIHFVDYCYQCHLTTNLPTHKMFNFIVVTNSLTGCYCQANVGLLNNAVISSEPSVTSTMYEYF